MAEGGRSPSPPDQRKRQQREDEDDGEEEDASSTAAGAEDAPAPPSAHDLLALGEVGLALAVAGGSEASLPDVGAAKHPPTSPSSDQVSRLPLLLRLLSAARPRSSAPSIPGLTSAAAGAEEDEGDASSSPSSPPDETATDRLDDVVAELEKCAASHAESEGIEDLVGRLAPASCRRIGGVGPLRRSRAGEEDGRPTGGGGGRRHHRRRRSHRAPPWDGSYETSELSAVALSALSGRSRKRKARSRGGDDGADADSTDEIEADDDDEDDEGGFDGAGGGEEERSEEAAVLAAAAAGNRMLAEILPESAKARLKKSSSPGGGGGGGGSGASKKRKANDDDGGGDGPREGGGASASFFERASSEAMDSQESAVRRTLGEVSTLVAESVSAPTGKGRKSLALQVKSDSLLAELPLVKRGGGAGGAGEEGARTSAAVFGGWTDLSSTVAAIMHHAPVLRHRHMANALCRAAVPQAADLIGRMAANCPAASPALLRGCVDAYQSATADAAAVAATAAAASTTTAANTNLRSIADAATESVRAIAELSKGEGCRAASALSRRGVLPGLALELWLDHDVDSAAASIVEVFRCAGSVEERPKKDVPEGGPERVSSGGTGVSGTSSDDPADPAGAGAGKGAAPATSAQSSSSLRRRIAPRRPDGRPPSVAAGASATARSRDELVRTLLNDKALAAKARERLASSVASLDVDGCPVPWGRASLLARALGLLVHRAGIGAGSSPGSGSAFVEGAARALGRLGRRLPVVAVGGGGGPDDGRDDVDAATPASSVGDAFRATAICAAVVAVARFPPVGDAGRSFRGGGAAESAAGECLEALLGPSVSRRSDAFAARIAAFAVAEDAAELRGLAVRSLRGGFGAATVEGGGEADDEGGDLDAFFNACRFASSVVDLPPVARRGVEPAVVARDATALADAVRRRSMDDNELDAAVKGLLCDPSKSRGLLSDGGGGAVALVRHAVAMLLDREKGLKVPLVLPLHIESLALKISRRQDQGGEAPGADRGENDGLWCQFVLQLLYCLEFLHGVPDSPFAVDPLDLPLKEALSFCDDLIGRSEADSEMKMLQSRLRFLVQEECPSAVSEARVLFVGDGTAPVAEMSLTIVRSPDRASRTAVSDAIRACIHEEGSSEESGRRAERAFLQAKADGGSAAVDAAATCALLSAAHSPPPSFSYSCLSRDPLVLLKCPLSTWKCGGLRRIILNVLQRLLVANDRVVRRTAPTDESASELLAARNTIVVRCLAIAGSGGFLFWDGGAGTKGKMEPTHCPLTVGLVRSLVARNRGVVAAVLKQGLPDVAVDWIVEFVPESLSDASALADLLSERNSLTATERLAAADASLRIAIAHGPRDKENARPLAYAAMTVLVSSFSLVLGPIGVPVNVLTEEGGKDVTQACRQSTFRMLGALQKISGRRVGLKNEAGMALQKIAAMCKSESVMGGVAGVAAARRKAVLKEIWDAVVRAINAMGGGIQI